MIVEFGAQDFARVRALASAEYRLVEKRVVEERSVDEGLMSGVRADSGAE
jgi:hypothetical protein